MAKLIAFLVFLCFEFSRQEEIAVVKKPKDVLLAELPFPEEQIIHKTYPLDIKVDNEKDFLKSTEETEPFSRQLENSWETAADSDDQMWNDFFEVTLGIEDFMEKANPSMKNFKWLRVLEEGSVAKGTISECSLEEVSIFDWENDEDSWLKSRDGNTKLIEEYDKLVSLIEKWMVKANPKYGHYEWLRVIEEVTAASCDDYDSSSYDYYYDTDIALLDGAKESHKKRLPASRKLKYKRFTSV